MKLTPFKLEKKSKKPIVYAFIDSQNLNLGIQDQGWRLDFGRFRIYLKDKYHIAKAFLFIGYIPKYKKLYNSLKNFGYVLIFKPTLPRLNGETKGNVDAELVLHAMIELPHYDKSVIISGDGDFHCLIEYLENNRKLARVIIPNRKKYSQLLWKFNRHIDYLNNLKEKLGETKKGASL